MRSDRERRRGQYIEKDVLGNAWAIEKGVNCIEAGRQRNNAEKKCRKRWIW
jgi:hypothetical protein